jgi:hypothetical protein
MISEGVIRWPTARAMGLFMALIPASCGLGLLSSVKLGKAQNNLKALYFCFVFFDFSPDYFGGYVFVCHAGIFA